MAETRNNNIFTWLGEQPDNFIDKVYGYQYNLTDSEINSNDENNESIDKSSPYIFACRAVFQSLLPLSKVYIMRTLFLDYFTLNNLLIWINKSNNNQNNIIEHENSLKELKTLRLFLIYNNENTMDTDESYLCISKYFKQSFMISLLSPCEPWLNQINLVNDSSLPLNQPIDLIDKNNIDKWNDVLKYLMSINVSTLSISNSIKEFLKKHMKLIADSSNKQSKHILTSKGYEFMLKDFKRQIWEFVWHIIEHFPNQEESISLLFMLSYSQAGKGYPVKALTKTQRQLVAACMEIGIIYLPTKSSSLFYPTTTAINLIFNNISEVSTTNEITDSLDFTPMNISSKADMKIIVETNMQVTSYVSTDLHIELLKLFVDVNVRLPNMVIGRISREKAKEAYSVGITVAQIIDFLSSHAHSAVIRSENNKLLVPDNVIDQLVLWHSEDQRMRMNEAIVVKFDSNKVTSQMFHDIITLANRINSCLWHDDHTLTIALNPVGFESIQSFLDDYNS